MSVELIGLTDWDSAKRTPPPRTAEDRRRLDKSQALAHRGAPLVRGGFATHEGFDFRGEDH
jgi:hypothetical protein